MHYPATKTLEDGEWVVLFPDCPGCQTQVEAKDDIVAMAQEALEGWLESHLSHGEAPPRPSLHRQRHLGGFWVPVAPELAIQLQLRWVRQAAKLTQGQVAKLAHFTQQQIARLEKPGYNPTVATLTRVADALGVTLEIHLRPKADQARSERGSRPRSSTQLKASQQ